MGRQTAFRRTAAWLLSVALLWSAMPQGARGEQGSVQIHAAALSQSSAPLNGMVRVWLSSLGNPSRLDLTVQGSYCLNGDVSRSFANGDVLALQFSSSTGVMTLSQGGNVVATSGGQLTLRRRSAAGSNGVLISQSRESGNPYPGDVSFQSVRQSSGNYKLYTVVHVYLEDYLYGVVPYEMGNSSNVEALKAQAVAARTYTVRRMQQRSSALYDVVDTTSDQVYRGTPKGNANCVSAIDSTRGIVLKYGGDYAITYYSASNGGQTESAKNGMGSGSYAYFTVKDDPFDYANPSSTVKKKTIYKDLTSASNPSGLTALLQRKVDSAMNQSGATLQTLQSVTPHTPKYAAPSRLYTKMDFTLTVRKADGSTQSATVTCDIFSELESLLGMSIQSAKNELWSVEETASAFVLQARRYGHGVGMSQRGAMYMGKLGYTYDEILGFYYEGCQRVQQQFISKILSASGDSEEETVQDPADLGQSDSAACRGTVRLVSSGGELAMRAGKSTGASVLCTLNNGAVVQVFSNDGSWCYVQYGSLKGFVPAEALTISGTPEGAEGEATAVQGFSTVTANDYVNLREQPSLSAKKLSTASTGAVLTVLSVSGDWAYVQYCGATAYVHRNFISPVLSSYPGQTSSSTGSKATVVTPDGTGTVNLRPAASTSVAALARIPHGTQVDVLSDDGSWCRIAWNGRTGYMMRAFLRFEQEEENENAPTPTPAPATPAPEETLVPGETAKVNVSTTFLRQLPRDDAPFVTTLSYGSIVRLVQEAGEWYWVSCDGNAGYLRVSELSRTDSSTPAPSSTPVQTAAPTPAPGGSSATLATVTTVSGGLNLRMEAKLGSPVLVTIPRGALVTVDQRGESWCAVRYGGRSGYVMTSFLTFSAQSAPTPTPDAPSQTDSSAGSVVGTVTTASGTLNLRQRPSSQAKIIARLPRFAVVEVFSVGSAWCGVRYGGMEGYVMTSFLTLSSGNLSTPEPDATPAPGAGNVPSENAWIATVQTSSGGLNLRAEPRSGAKVLSVIPRFAAVEVLGGSGVWLRVRYGGIEGYAMAMYLLAQTDVAGATASSAPSSAPTAGETSSSPTPSPAPVDAEPKLESMREIEGGSLAIVEPPEGSDETIVWSECAEGSEVLARLNRGDMVRVVQMGENWCCIQYDMQNANKYGYCLEKYLSLQEYTSWE